MLHWGISVKHLDIDQVYSHRIKNAQRKARATGKDLDPLLVQIQENANKRLTTSEDSPRRPQQVLRNVQENQRLQRTEAFKKYAEHTGRQQRRLQRTSKQKKKFWDEYLQLVKRHVEAQEQLGKALCEILAKQG